MTDTGIVRRVDELGRVVIPIELRKQLGLSVKDPLSISVEDGQIIMTKYDDACFVCGNENLKGAIEMNDKVICKDCQQKIASRA